MRLKAACMHVLEAACMSQEIYMNYHSLHTAAGYHNSTLRCTALWRFCTHCHSTTAVYRSLPTPTVHSWRACLLSLPHS
jgi:hypothetical protein